MIKPTAQPTQSNASGAADIVVASPEALMPLDAIKATSVDDYPVAPDMPALGDRVLLTAIFGRMVHPEKPEVEHELDVGKLTRATFDWWHANLWRAGRVKLAEV